MDFVAICPKCNELRYRSKPEFDPSQGAVEPDDFEPLGDQPPARRGQPAKCYVCQTDLAFRRFEGSQNGHGQARENIRERARASALATVEESTAVQTLFAAQPGEEVTTMREVGTGKLLVITTKRIVLVDLDSLIS